MKKTYTQITTTAGSFNVSEPAFEIDTQCYYCSDNSIVCLTLLNGSTIRFIYRNIVSFIEITTEE